MGNRVIRTTLAVGIIILFLGASFLPVIDAEIRNKARGDQFFIGSTPVVADKKIFSGSGDYKIDYFGSDFNQRRNIMLTGFWNPTGLMLTQFSTDPELNPDGWIGENWEGLGYDIYSYFPKPGIYTGMFEVDYQDTWEDFWAVTAQINPVAIISFGAGAGPWEIEYNARNLDIWYDDYNPPYQPTPCPPDDTEPVNFIRHSSLPVQEIETAVDDQTSINAWVDWNGNPGAFLCEFIAYLGMWYQAEHNSTEDPYRCLASGFIHVNAGVVLEEAIKATEVTIREVIKNFPNNSPDIPTISGPTNGDKETEYPYTFNAADIDNDDVKYIIDWGDGKTDMTDFYQSGTDVIVKHTWDEEGTYIIKAKAEDEHGSVSLESTFTVTMPRNRAMNIPFINYLQYHPNLFLLFQRLLNSLEK